MGVRLKDVKGLMMSLPYGKTSPYWNIFDQQGSRAVTLNREKLAILILVENEGTTDKNDRELANKILADLPNLLEAGGE